MNLRRTIVLLGAVACLAGFSGTASADSSTAPSVNYVSVYNPGNNPGDTCNNTLYAFDGTNYTFVGYYAGHEVLVQQGGGLRTLECMMNLVFGPGVSSTLVLDLGSLHQVYTPSGKALYNLHA